MANKINPWAVCHSQLGKKKTDKFERCVMKIKTKHGIKDWTEFKAALRYLSETVQGQKEDILAARERQEKEKKEKSSTKPVKSLGVKEALKSATSTGLVRGRIGKRPKGDEEEHEMRRQKGILAHTESEGPSLKEKLNYLAELGGGQKAVTSTATPKKEEHPAGEVYAAVEKWKKRWGKGGSKVKELPAHLRTHTEHEGPSLKEKLAHLAEKDWIQGAVNPKHKGYCTPMTKKTCTPARKALAKRFKKAGRREGTKKGGKTGWKGKV